MKHVVKFNQYSVLFQALGTIFGAAMFLLFGTALGNVGLLNMMLIMVLGHVVTGAVAYTRPNWHRTSAWAAAANTPWPRRPTAPT